MKTDYQQMLDAVGGIEVVHLLRDALDPVEALEETKSVMTLRHLLFDFCRACKNTWQSMEEVVTNYLNTVEEHRRSLIEMRELSKSLFSRLEEEMRRREEMCFSLSLPERPNATWRSIEEQRRLADHHNQRRAVLVERMCSYVRIEHERKNEERLGLWQTFVKALHDRKVNVRPSECTTEVLEEAVKDEVHHLLGTAKAREVLEKASGIALTQQVLAEAYVKNALVPYTSEMHRRLKLQS